jgi:hypothetical protein
VTLTYSKDIVLNVRLGSKRFASQVLRQARNTNQPWTTLHDKKRTSATRPQHIAFTTVTSDNGKCFSDRVVLSILVTSCPLPAVLLLLLLLLLL